MPNNIKRPSMKILRNNRDPSLYRTCPPRLTQHHPSAEQ
ncbi:hypothetical protein C4K04_3981 [Pseudomonas chlororaphis]|uniref:Uncharacterized protein n=1 Tax=Pseudomonas chlororaphis TaxID=587753 RepID=A0A3G7TRE0_9PSED|nr:hypothetical protein C4K04_3981 [Pseudomonas chlororaphis]